MSRRKVPLSQGTKQALFALQGYLESEIADLQEDEELDQEDTDLQAWIEEMTELTDKIEALPDEIEVDEAEGVE